MAQSNGSLKALGNNNKSEVINVTIATSMAISVPLPIAILTSARANACESSVSYTHLDVYKRQAMPHLEGIIELKDFGVPVSRSEKLAYAKAGAYNH